MEAETGEHRDRQRLAELIVDVLEVGSRKVDRLAADFLAAFDIDLDAIVDSQHDYSEQAKVATRSQLVAELVDRGPDVQALVETFLRCGAAVIDMVDGIYSLLAAHAATVGERSESFVVRPDADIELTISPAFVEELRTMVRQFEPFELGVADAELLSGLVGMDGGESYGGWPPTEDERIPLLHKIMILGPMRARLAIRAEEAPEFVTAVHAGEVARTAANRLVRRLEQILEGAGAYMLDNDLDPRPDDTDRYEREVDLLRTHGLLGGPVVDRYFDELDRNAFLGTQVADGDPLEPVEASPVRRDDLVDRWGGALCALGTYVAILRTPFTMAEDRWTRWNDPVSVSDLLDAPTPDAAIKWLGEMTDAANRALVWVDDELWTVRERRPRPIDLDVIESWLRLPLWRQRHALFELWLLCHTISTAASAGWVPKLGGVEGEVWTLPERSTDTPVATLHRDDQTLAVWQEPAGEVTPDVTVRTTDQAGGDLVVIEAKDRHKMRSGLDAHSGRSLDPDSALGIAARYSKVLKPALTWLFNHSSFGGAPPDPDRDEGSPWHRIHLAGNVAPAQLPDGFSRSVVSSLEPPGDPARDVPRSALVFVLDTTGSMKSAFRELLECVRELPAAANNSYSAILYGDHGDEYVVRPTAAFPTPEALIEAIGREPLTHGQDAPEALEDAMRHSAWLADAYHVFVVATDAPPHSPEDCPEGIEFSAEVQAVLDAGASLVVLRDWYGATPEEWDPFADHPRFAFTALSGLARQLSGQPSARRDKSRDQAGNTPLRSPPRVGVDSCGHRRAGDR